MKRFTKKQIIAAAVLILLLVMLGFMGALEKLGRFAHISKDIANNLMHPVHGDGRSLKEITAVYIKENTGTTDVIDYKYIPEALKPFKKYTHPPFEMGACAVCHAPNRSKPAAIVTREVGDLCYKCHEPIGGIKKHGGEIDCNKCHSPHHADREKLLRDNVTQINCPAGTFDPEKTFPDMENHHY